MKQIMQRTILFLAFLLATVAGNCQERTTTTTFPADLDTRFTQQITDKNIVGASAAYAVDGKTIWLSATGYADMDAKQPFQHKTKVRMASIAKSMTAIAVMQLVEQGLINLDVPIQTYIPDYPIQAKTQITTRHLLSHTSGLNGYKSPKEAETKINYPTLTDAVELFKNRPLLFEPGTQYSYTTYGYTLLGLLIEKVSGLSYEAYMKKNIWEKAGMMNTGVEVYGNRAEGASKLYRRDKKGKLKEGVENNLSNRIPGGGLYTTVVDMLKFGNAVLDNTFIKRETLELMRQHHSLEKERNAYGFGWFLYNPKPNEGAIIGHSGAQTGCSSQLFLIPEKGIVTVVLTNTSGAAKEATTFAAQLMKIALNK